MEECVFTSIDYMIPGITQKTSDFLYEPDGDSYGLVNKLEQWLEYMNRQGNTLIYKAMIEFM